MELSHTDLFDDLSTSFLSNDFDSILTILTEEMPVTYDENSDVTLSQAPIDNCDKECGKVKNKEIKSQSHLCQSTENSQNLSCPGKRSYSDEKLCPENTYINSSSDDANFKTPVAVPVNSACANGKVMVNSTNKPMVYSGDVSNVPCVAVNKALSNFHFKLSDQPKEEYIPSRYLYKHIPKSKSVKNTLSESNVPILTPVSPVIQIYQNIFPLDTSSTSSSPQTQTINHIPSSSVVKKEKGNGIKMGELKPILPSTIKMVAKHVSASGFSPVISKGIYSTAKTCDQKVQLLGSSLPKCTPLILPSTQAALGNTEVTHSVTAVQSSSLELAAAKIPDPESSMTSLSILSSMPKDFSDTHSISVISQSTGVSTVKTSPQELENKGSRNNPGNQNVLIEDLSFHLSSTNATASNSSIETLSSIYKCINPEISSAENNKLDSEAVWSEDLVAHNKGKKQIVKAHSNSNDMNAGNVQIKRKVRVSSRTTRKKKQKCTGAMDTTKTIDFVHSTRKNRHILPKCESEIEHNLKPKRTYRRCKRKPSKLIESNILQDLSGKAHHSDSNLHPSVFNLPSVVNYQTNDTQLYSPHYDITSSSESRCFSAEHDHSSKLGYYGAEYDLNADNKFNNLAANNQPLPFHGTFSTNINNEKYKTQDLFDHHSNSRIMEIEQKNKKSVEVSSNNRTSIQQNKRITKNDSIFPDGSKNESNTLNKTIIPPLCNDHKITHNLKPKRTHTGRKHKPSKLIESNILQDLSGKAHHSDSNLHPSVFNLPSVVNYQTNDTQLYSPHYDITSSESRCFSAERDHSSKLSYYGAEYDLNADNKFNNLAANNQHLVSQTHATEVNISSDKNEQNAHWKPNVNDFENEFGPNMLNSNWVINEEEDSKLSSGRNFNDMLAETHPSMEPVEPISFLNHQNHLTEYLYGKLSAKGDGDVQQCQNVAMQKYSQNNENKIIASTCEQEKANMEHSGKYSKCRRKSKGPSKSPVNLKCDRPYICGYCGKCEQYMVILERHIRLEHGYTPLVLTKI